MSHDRELEWALNASKEDQQRRREPETAATKAAYPDKNKPHQPTFVNRGSVLPPLWLIPGPLSKDSSKYIQLLPIESGRNGGSTRQFYGNMFRIYEWISFTLTFIHRNEFRSGSYQKTQTIELATKHLQFGQAFRDADSKFAIATNMYRLFDRTLRKYSELRASTELRSSANKMKIKVWDRLVELYAIIANHLQESHDWLMHLERNNGIGEVMEQSKVWRLFRGVWENWSADEFNALFDETKRKAVPGLSKEQADERIRSFLGSKINKRNTLRGVRNFLAGHKRKNRAASVIQRAVRRRGTRENDAFYRFLDAPDSPMDFNMDVNTDEFDPWKAWNDDHGDTHEQNEDHTQFDMDAPDEYAHFDADVPEQDTHATNEDEAASKISRNLRNLVRNKYIFRGSRPGYSHKAFVLWWYDSTDGSRGVLAQGILKKRQCQGTLPSGARCKTECVLGCEYCFFHLRDIKHLQIRQTFTTYPNTERRTELGLFALSKEGGVVFRAGDDIMDFLGDELTMAARQARYRNVEKTRYLIHLIQDSRNKHQIVYNDGTFLRTVASLAQHSDHPNAEIRAHNQRDAMTLFATQDIHNGEEITIPHRNGFNIDDPLPGTPFTLYFHTFQIRTPDRLPGQARLHKTYRSDNRDGRLQRPVTYYGTLPGEGDNTSKRYTMGGQKLGQRWDHRYINAPKRSRRYPVKL